MSTLTNDPVGTSTPNLSARAAVRAGNRSKSRPRTRFLVAALIVVAAVGYMIYSAIESGSEYYTTTSELLAMGDKAIGQQTKLGGRVVDGSVQWDKGSNTVAFALQDDKQQNLPIIYTGIVPDSFAPGVDVILEGKLGTDGRFQANSMLAKCASKYEPK